MSIVNGLTNKDIKELLKLADKLLHCPKCDNLMYYDYYEYGYYCDKCHLIISKSFAKILQEGFQKGGIIK